MTKTGLARLFTGACLCVATPWTLAQDSLVQNDGQNNGLLAYWSFDDASGTATVEGVQKAEDTIEGNFSFVDGVRGKGLKFDGFTTRVTRDSFVNGKWNAPEIKDALTVETWIAPQAYPWNWNAIVEQRDRYFFGLDETGHIGFRVYIDNHWRECVSITQVPFMQWSHIAGTFDPNNGLTIYINGQEAGRLKISGRFSRRESGLRSGSEDKYFAATRTGGGAFQIGRNLDELPAAASRPIPASYSFDGIIDELRIYGRALDASEIQGFFESTRPASQPPLTWRKLPRIPDGERRFGAFYTALKFYPEWDRLWRIDEYPDIVVTFDGAAYKMVFWHGTTYGLSLVMENGQWMGDQSAEAHRSVNGCVEHMSDKQARYSHVRLIESSPARVVVHWRYALTDVLYNIGEQDPITGWGDWADEYYTIYPDGWAVRHILLHAPRDRYSMTAPQVLNNPGERLEDNMSADAVTLANLDGLTGPAHGDPLKDIPNANIAIVNLKSDFKPVWVYEPPTSIGYEGKDESPTFETFDHWPVAQIPSDGRPALALDRFSSSEIFAPKPPEAKREGDGTVEARWLTGFANQPASTIPAARAWLQPPTLKISGVGFTSDGYNRDDRAYHLRRLEPSSTKLKFSIQASEKSPTVNPAFVINGWGHGDASLRLNGKPIAEGKDFRVGHIDHLEGSNLVIWVHAQLTGPSDFSITQIPGSQ